MTELPDTDLDRRLRAAGALLDGWAGERAAAAGPRRRPALPDLRRGPRLVVAAAAAAFVLLAVGAAVVLRSDPAPDDDRPPAATRPDGPAGAGALRLSDLPGLGIEGRVATTHDGLVDLATGTMTPMTTPADWAGDLGSPTAVPDGEGGVYYLSTVAEPDDGVATAGDPLGHMDLRRLTADGRDELLQEGITSFAVRHDGAVAVALAQEVDRYNAVPYPTDINVREPDGTLTTWSTGPGDLDVVAWAGDRLLVERGIEDTEAVDTVVYDGPGRARDLASYGRPLAVGPGGRWAVVDGVEPGAERPDTTLAVAPRVLDLATGAVLGTVSTGDPTLRVDDLTWAGDDRLVAAATAADGRRPVLVDLAVAERTPTMVAVTATRVAELDPAATWGAEVAWAGPDGTLVALAPGRDHRARLYVCPVDEPCRLLVPPFGQEPGQLALVVDPSRPPA